jgi:D-galactarolactone isomerase
LPAAAAPQLRAPPGACDCHIHVFDRRFPWPAGAHFQPFEAPVADYRRMQRRLGLARVVIVQSSAYGTDNRGMLDAVAAMDGQARGIAMVAPDVTDAELRRLRNSGVAGLRFLMAEGGVVPWGAVERLAARAAAHDLVVNLQLDGRTLPEHRAMLLRLPGTLVIDHVGMFKAPVTPQHPGFATLLDLLATGRVWVKLSAPYAGGLSGPPPYPAVGSLVRMLAAAAPNRLVWGSNWPHPFSVVVRGGVAEDDAMLLDLLLEWIDDAALRDAILADHPAALFGFPPT